MDALDDRSDHYLVAHVQERLAEDDELGIGVSVAGNTVVLTGTVATRERRDAAERAANEMVGDRRLRNEITVADLSEPAGTEEVS